MARLPWLSDDMGQTFVKDDFAHRGKQITTLHHPCRMPSDLRRRLCGLHRRDIVAFVRPVDISRRASPRGLQGAISVTKCTLIFKISRDPDIVIGEAGNGRPKGILTELHGLLQVNGTWVIALKDLWKKKPNVTRKVKIKVFVQKSSQLGLVG